MPESEWLSAIAALRRARRPGVLVTLAAVRGHAPRAAGAKLVVDEGQAWGSIGGGNLEAVAIDRARARLAAGDTVPELFTLDLSERARSVHGVQCCGGSVIVLLEPLPVVPAVAVFGVGHVGWELARVLARHDIDLHLVDTRPGQLTEGRLAVLADAVARVHVHRPAMLPESVLAELPPATHVLIMTHDHAEDFALCDAALRGGDLSSIGLIGSAAKWARFRARLTAAGHEPAAIARITTPIGLPGIRGKEPATLALSVAVELVRFFESAPTTTFSPLPCRDKGTTVNDDRESAAELAAYAAFFEMAEGLHLSDLLDGERSFTLDEAVAAADVPETAAAGFLGALLAGGLLRPGSGPREFVPGPDMAGRRHRAGYLSWSLNANRPYLDNAAEFARDPAAAGRLHRRDGRKVAVSSRWIGSQGFYPGVLDEIIGRKPQRIVDLGAGAGAMLINLLTALPGSTGVALDISPAACEEATAAARRSGLDERLDVVNRSIESLIEDSSPLDGADVVHAGFVMHDTVAEPDVATGILEACRRSLNDRGCVVITDAVPYAAGPERAFSALFTYLHAGSMRVNLPTEAEWHALIRRAGFTDVTTTPLGMPGSRMFLATRHG